MYWDVLKYGDVLKNIRFFFVRVINQINQKTILRWEYITIKLISSLPNLRRKMALKLITFAIWWVFLLFFMLVLFFASKKYGNIDSNSWCVIFHSLKMPWVRKMCVRIITNGVCVCAFCLRLSKKKQSQRCVDYINDCNELKSLESNCERIFAFCLCFKFILFSSSTPSTAHFFGITQFFNLIWSKCNNFFLGTIYGENYEQKPCQSNRI